MTFKKGERVMCIDQDGVTHHGTVIRGGSKTIEMVEDDGVKHWLGGVSHFTLSTTQPPKNTVDIPSWKKGDRVMFKSGDSGTIHGTVEKGGSARIHVVEDGGEYAWTVHARALKVSDKELPKDDFESPMKDYEVKGYRVSKIATYDGYPWEAKIYKNGKHVIDVNDPATGGPVNFWPKSSQKSDVVKEAQDKAKQWFMLCGCPEEGLPPCDGLLGMWVTWYAEHRPRGVTGKQYYKREWEDFAEQIVRGKEQKV